MADTYLVIPRDPFSLSVPPVSEIVAKVTGQTKLDVAHQLRRNRGLVARGLQKAQANRMVEALRGAGTAAFALAEADRVVFPEHVHLSSVRFGDDDLIAELADANQKPLGPARIPYEDIVLLTCGLVRFTKKKRTTRPVSNDAPLPNFQSWRPMGTLGVSLRSLGRYSHSSANPPGNQNEHHHEDRHLLDLFAVEPAHHLRIEADRFSFARTGLPMQPTRILNLIALIKCFSARCSEAFVDPGIRYILDGNPRSNLRFQSIQQYRAYLDWRVQMLYHFGGE